MPSFDAATSFYFMRHGQTEHNRLGLRCGGDLDLPLTPLGCAQVAQAARVLRRAEPPAGVILTSPLARTRASAEIVAAACGGLAIVTVPALVERHLGGWNGQAIEATEAALRAGQTPPGGESEAAFEARIRSAFDALRGWLPQRPLWLASKGVARQLGQLLALPDRLQLDNAQVLAFDCRPPSFVALRRLPSDHEPANPGAIAPPSV